MAIIKFTTLLFIFVCFVSCDNSTLNKDIKGTTILDNSASQKSNSIRQSLVGQIFIFAPELDSLTNTAIGTCDCCSSNILFLTDSTFVDIGYCEANTTYSKGLYSLDNGKIQLNYLDLIVKKDYNWEKDTDTLKRNLADYFYKAENVKKFTQTYQRQEIKGKIIFKDKNEFGTIDNKRKYNEELQRLKAENIWALLKL